MKINKSRLVSIKPRVARRSRKKKTPVPEHLSVVSQNLFRGVCDEYNLSPYQLNELLKECLVLDAAISSYLVAGGDNPISSGDDEQLLSVPELQVKVGLAYAGLIRRFAVVNERSWRLDQAV
jgi:hypothetical protein